MMIASFIPPGLAQNLLIGAAAMLFMYDMVKDFVRVRVPLRKPAVTSQLVVPVRVLQRPEKTLAGAQALGRAA